MRSKEEKVLIITEIITLGFIVIASILAQFVDAKIKDYNDNILTAELRRSNYIQLYSYHSQRIEYWELSGALAQLGKPLKKEMVIVDDPIARPENVGTEYKELMDRYKSNEIDVHTYIVEMGNIYRNKAEYYKSRIKQVGSYIKNTIKNPPKLFLINIFLLKSSCLNTQLIGALIGIMLLVKLFIEINKRTKKQIK